MTPRKTCGGRTDGFEELPQDGAFRVEDDEEPRQSDVVMPPVHRVHQREGFEETDDLHRANEKRHKCNMEPLKASRERQGTERAFDSRYC